MDKLYSILFMNFVLFVYICRLTKEEKEIRCGLRAARVPIAMSDTVATKDKSRNETEQNLTVSKQLNGTRTSSIFLLLLDGVHCAGPVGQIYTYVFAFFVTMTS